MSALAKLSRKGLRLLALQIDDGDPRPVLNEPPDNAGAQSLRTPVTTTLRFLRSGISPIPPCRFFPEIGEGAVLPSALKRRDRTGPI